MLAKFDTTLYFNPHSLVPRTRLDKASFLDKKVKKIRERYQPPTPPSKKTSTPFVN